MDRIGKILFTILRIGIVAVQLPFLMVIIPLLMIGILVVTVINAESDYEKFKVEFVKNCDVGVPYFEHIRTWRKRRVKKFIKDIKEQKGVNC